MFIHNPTIALRNLGKYRLQTTISIVSIAISIVTLAIVHSYVQTRLAPPLLTTLPYYDRICSLTLDSLHVEETAKKRPIIDFNGEALRAVKAGGELHSVEQGPIFYPRMISGGDCFFSLGDTLRRVSKETMLPVEVSFPNYSGLRSVLSGEPIARLRAGEAIISELRARKIFGDINPVGAIMTLRKWTRTGHIDKDYTVVDVYANPGYNSWPRPTEAMYCIDESEIGRDGEEDYMSWVTMVVLKENCTPEQLEQEINVRLAPLGWKVKVELEKEDSAESIRSLSNMRTLGYLMGALILLAACIGFLRMQLQLFRMRRREISLRIVNGAKRRDLFHLLMTEVGLVLLAAVAVALLLGQWLEPFINALFENTGDSSDMRTVEHLLTYSVAIGAILLLVIGTVVWFALRNICRNAYNLAEGMRGERSHTFRNVMLWLQITVGMLFVRVAMFTAVLCDRLSQAYVLPEDDRRYRESILVKSDEVRDRYTLNAALQSLPDVAQVVSYYSLADQFDEINDSLCKNLNFVLNRARGIEMSDTIPLDYFNVQVTWLRPEHKDKDCLLIDEEVYAVLDSAGVLANGVLTGGYGPLPVAGTFSDMELTEREGWNRPRFIVIVHRLKNYSGTNILVPKPGKYGALWDEVEATVARLEPTLVQRVVFNFYAKEGAEIELLSNVRKAGWILGGVALLVCVMGIYSTIVLDTRARRKEMAIRKINGAKSWDIARIFARLYVLLTALAMLVTIPLAFVLQSHYFDAYYVADEIQDTLPTALLVLAGCLTVILSIVLIVGWQVRGIMRVNPAEIIAKE